jgi:5'(3')-deoxyribonucleotidase
MNKIEKAMLAMAMMAQRNHATERKGTEVNRLRIAVDFDSTLADTSGLILKLMNWRLGTSYKPEDWNTWDFWFATEESEEAFWGLFDLMDATYLRRALPPVDPFAPAVVKWLMKRGHEVHLVSMNKESAKASFEGWLWAQGIEMPIVTRGRHSPKSKASLDYDIFIDDSPELAKEMADHLSKTLILYARPHNAQILPSENVILALDWLEIKESLEELGA